MEFIHDKEAFYKYLFQNCGCANAGQSPTERRLKYAIARHFGKSPSWARSLRDYRTTVFARWFGYNSWESLIKSISEENNNG